MGETEAFFEPSDNESDYEKAKMSQKFNSVRSDYEQEENRDKDQYQEVRSHDPNSHTNKLILDVQNRPRISTNNKNKNITSTSLNPIREVINELPEYAAFT